MTFLDRVCNKEDVTDQFPLDEELADYLIKNKFNSRYDISNNKLDIDVSVTVEGEICYFLCPFCRSSYKKNGQPRKTSKPIYHTHGWDGQNMSRRTPHCPERIKTLYNLPPYDFILRDERFILKFR